MSMKKVEVETVVKFLKSLEGSKLIRPNAHKEDLIIDSVRNLISMTEEEHDEFQKNKPNKSVLTIFTEYQDWKETNL